MFQGSQVFISEEILQKYIKCYIVDCTSQIYQRPWEIPGYAFCNICSFLDITFQNTVAESVISKEIQLKFIRKQALSLLRRILSDVMISARIKFRKLIILDDKCP